MGLKSDLTPVDRVGQLDASQREALAKLHVTTVEELVGMLEADPTGVGDLLGLDAKRLDSLVEETSAALDPATREELTARSGETHAHGAWNPAEHR